MKYWVNYLADYHYIRITEKQTDAVVVQEIKNGNKSRKSLSTIKYYNDKPYIMCKGHRYYLDKFKEIEL